MPSTRRSLLAACTTGVGALAGCLTLEQPTADGDWPRRTLNNAHTGYATTEGPTADLHTVWTRRRYNEGPPTSPIVEDGTLYLAYSREPRGDTRGGAWIEAFEKGSDKCAMGLRFKEISKENQDQILKYIIKAQITR